MTPKPCVSAFTSVRYLVPVPVCRVYASLSVCQGSWVTCVGAGWHAGMQLNATHANPLSSPHGAPLRCQTAWHESLMSLCDCSLNNSPAESAHSPLHNDGHCGAEWCAGMGYQNKSEWRVSHAALGRNIKIKSVRRASTLRQECT